MTRIPNCAFFKIADGYGGHTQVLALFDRSNSPDYRGTTAATSTIDHIAFEISLSDFENELKRLRALGLQVETAEHSWVHWRSLYVNDPEGNQVELVCYDEVCEEWRPPANHTPSGVNRGVRFAKFPIRIEPRQRNDCS
jgi:catechol-2,3-dioxygenase